MLLARPRTWPGCTLRTPPYSHWTKLRVFTVVTILCLFTVFSWFYHGPLYSGDSFLETLAIDSGRCIPHSHLFDLSGVFNYATLKIYSFRGDTIHSISLPALYKTWQSITSKFWVILAVPCFLTLTNVTKKPWEKWGKHFWLFGLVTRPEISSTRQTITRGDLSHSRTFALSAEVQKTESHVSCFIATNRIIYPFALL